MFYKEKQYFTQGSYGNIFKNEDDSSEDLIDQYLKDNPETGFIIFQLYEDSPTYGRMPVSNAKITINGELGNGLSMEKVYFSDASGKTEPIPLPTVPGQLSFDPQANHPYSTYSAIVETADYLSINLSNVPIFHNVTTIQPISLTPKTKYQIPASLGVQPDYFSGGM